MCWLLKLHEINQALIYCTCFLQNTLIAEFYTELVIDKQVIPVQCSCHVRCMCAIYCRTSCN